jgi:single-stranded-DNA-specific exonuclease
LDELHDPWLMKDMDKAVKRIMDAIRTGEKILVYGDYDVDGTTAVSSLYCFLKKKI